MFPTKSRFPLTQGRSPAADAPDANSYGGDGDGDRAGQERPFGLRFFTRETRPAAVAAFSYCEERQVTVDDTGRPVVHGPSASWSQTTTGNMDGNEETKMDQDPDSN